MFCRLFVCCKEKKQALLREQSQKRRRVLAHHFKKNCCASRDWLAPSALANLSGHKGYFEMAFEDVAPYLGPVARGTNRFLLFFTKCNAFVTLEWRAISKHVSQKDIERRTSCLRRRHVKHPRGRKSPPEHPLRVPGQTGGVIVISSRVPPRPF